MENLSPELNALLGFLSRVGVEILKDTGKYLGGKAKELYDSLNPHIIELGISKNDDNEIIRQKLAAKPEINVEIQRKISDNQEGFNELLKFMKENPHKIESKIQIGNVKENSNVNVSVNQGNKTQAFVFATLIIALMVIFAIAAMYFFTFSGKTETTIQNSTVNSNVSLQPTITPTNTNVISTQSVVKPNNERPKPTPSKIVSTKVVTQPKITVTPKKIVVIQQETKPKPDATPSDCSSTTEGCSK
jgi:hypothetical protein